MTDVRLHPRSKPKAILLQVANKKEHTWKIRSSGEGATQVWGGGFITPQMKSIDRIRPLNSICSTQLPKVRFVPASHSQQCQQKLILFIPQPQGTYNKGKNLARCTLGGQKLLQGSILVQSWLKQHHSRRPYHYRRGR